MIGKLNKILKESLDEIIINSKYSGVIESFLNIVLSNPLIIRTGQYHLTIPTEQSIEYSIDFINSINNEYADMARDFLSSLEYCNLIYRSDISSYVYNYKGHPKMNLFLSNTIEDSYVITHEIFHCINFGSTLNRALMTETISLTAERLQQEYLKEFVGVIECQKRELDILCGIIEIAYMLDFELKLVKHYLTYKKIDKDFVDNFISLKNRRYASIIKEDIEEIIGYNKLRYYYHQRYIIAIILSSLLVNRINDNPNNIKLFIELNDNCNTFSFIESLKYLGLEVVDKDNIILSDDSLNLLEREYQKRLTKL